MPTLYVYESVDEPESTYVYKEDGLGATGHILSLASMLREYLGKGYSISYNPPKDSPNSLRPLSSCKKKQIQRLLKQEG